MSRVSQLRYARCPVCHQNRLTVSTTGGQRKIRHHWVEPRYVTAPSVRCAGSHRLVREDRPLPRTTAPTHPEGETDA